MTTSFDILDIFLRGGAVTVLLICAALFLLRSGNSRKSYAVAGLCLSLCAYLLVSSHNLLLIDGTLAIVLVLIAGVVPAALYWAAVELFLDEVEFVWWQFAFIGFVVFGAWLAPIAPWLVPLRGVVIFLLLAHLLYVIVIGSPGDLVETRRRFRRWFFVAVIVFGAIIIVIEMTGMVQELPNLIFTLHAAAFLILSGTFVLWAAQIAPNIWVETTAPLHDKLSLSPADRALVSRVQQAMEDGVWRREALTVSQLALELNSQEHRLRRAINQVLGFRNFASFINGYRISAAQDMLRNPDMAEMPILSIAYEVGFASLGPFNRAFRKVTDLSPTEFRKSHVEVSGLL